MKGAALLLLSIFGAGAIEFGSHECANNCPANAKYGQFIGTKQATEMSGVRVFGAYHGNLF